MTRTVEPALTALRDQLLRMASLAEAILAKSLQSLWRRDVALAREVRIDDLDIDRLDIAVVLFGHAGDGHVHVNALPDVTRAGWTAAVRALYDAVSDLVIRLGGTPAGEHGAGRLRAGLMEQLYGAEIVARAAPDGYTYLVSSSPALVVNPSLYSNLPYNAERDFAPVARGVVSPLVIASHPSVPVKTLAGLIALAKREPGALSYGSPGAGSSSNLAVKMLEEAGKVRFLHVAYKGASQASLGLLRGEVAFMVTDISTALPLIQAKRVVPLAASHRSAHLPGTPTYAQAGFPSVDAYPSYSVVAPAGTPPAIVQRMSAEIVSLMKTPAFRERLDARAMVPIYDTPEQFASVLSKERAKYAELIRRSNITAE